MLFLKRVFNGMTEKQWETYRAIESFSKRGYSPTNEELAKKLKISVTGARKRVEQLQKIGRLNRLSGKARTAKLIPETT